MTTDEISEIAWHVVEPSPNGPRDCGVAKTTYIGPGEVVQVFFAEGSTGKFGRMVTRRIVTRGGVSNEEVFDPPLLQSKLPPIGKKRKRTR